MNGEKWQKPLSIPFYSRFTAASVFLNNFSALLSTLSTNFSPFPHCPSSFSLSQKSGTIEYYFNGSMHKANSTKKLFFLFFFITIELTGKIVMCHVQFSFFGFFWCFFDLQTHLIASVWKKQFLVNYLACERAIWRCVG